MQYILYLIYANDFYGAVIMLVIRVKWQSKSIIAWRRCTQVETRQGRETRSRPGMHVGIGKLKEMIDLNDIKEYTEGTEDDGYDKSSKMSRNASHSDENLFACTLAMKICVKCLYNTQLNMRPSIIHRIVHDCSHVQNQFLWRDTSP